MSLAAKHDSGAGRSRNISVRECAGTDDVALARNRAALAFARAVLHTRGGVSPEDLGAVRKAGFTDAEIAEIVAVVAVNVLTNDFNIAFDDDFPRVEPQSAAAP